MGSKMISSIWVLCCLFVSSSCQEAEILQVTDGQSLGAMAMFTTMRDRPPSSFLLRIQSYSLLDRAENIERYESAVFEAADYNWRLVLYPNGNKEDGGTGYISLYLKLENPKFTHNHYEIYVDVKLFVYNKKQDKFLTAQDGEIKHYHVDQIERGFPRVIPITTFKSAVEGYLMDDACTFGAEIFLIKPPRNHELFSAAKPMSDNATFTWKITGFTSLNREYITSENFTIAGAIWALRAYPRGKSLGQGNSLSLYLHGFGYEGCTTCNGMLYARYKLRVLNQIGKNNVEKEYFAAFPDDWGSPQFIPLTNLQDASNGFVVLNALIVQAEIIEVSASKSTYSSEGIKREMYV